MASGGFFKFQQRLGLNTLTIRCSPAAEPKWDPRMATPWAVGANESYRSPGNGSHETCNTICANYRFPPGNRGGFNLQK